MIEKIVFDKDLIKKIVRRNDVNILFIKYSPKDKRAFYKTDICTNYKTIDIERVIKL